MLNLLHKYSVQLLWALAILCVVLVARAGLFWSHVHGPLQLTQAEMLEVGSGASLRRVLRRLEDAGVLDHAGDLLLYARLSGLATHIKAGEYELAAGITGKGLLELLASGKVIYHQLRLGEGWTLKQALSAIQSHPAVQAVLDANDPDGLQLALGMERYPEGLFFPDTYNFTRGTTDLELLQRAAQLMQDILQPRWAARDAGLPFENSYEALVLASIVEKEAALENERGLIAGVFIRRLQLNMRLQADPTVVYGLGDAFEGRLTRSNLQQDTPWNTYTRHGLPPTPIALPGLASIEASLQPELGEYLFFVAKGDGSHQFSATLTEHNQAVRQYQLNNQAP